MKRRKYDWGRSDKLQNMKAGEVMYIPFIDRQDYNNWRTLASTLKSDLGGECFWQFRHPIGSEVIIVTRTI